MGNDLEIRIHDAIDEFSPAAWDAMVEYNYPFIKHAFLSSAEKYGCVDEEVGWIPRHLGLYQNTSLIAALPLYEKHNSWGEFVFDHGWADAYHRYNLRYYPKLVNAMPFSPATGQRMLVDKTQAERSQIANQLIESAYSVAKQNDYSGLHGLFVDPATLELIGERPNTLRRKTCQFHWHNDDYSDFDDFLARLKSKKRKNIRQERRRALASGITIKRLNGHQTTTKHWHDFAQLYAQIYHRKWGAPAFNQDFFEAIAAAMPDQVLLVTAELDDNMVAAAFMLKSDNTLFGRHWGCANFIDSLHFELCYYQGIEYCIEHNLQTFDPGAQGEHKLARGFLPTPTTSLHWMTDRPFQTALANFCNEENQHIEQYMTALRSHSPYSFEP